MRLFALLILLISCNGQVEKKSSHTLVLDWIPNPNHIPLFVGVEKGYFKKHGVPLKILRLRDSSDGLPSLGSGRADFAVHYMPRAIKAASEGISFKVAATLIDHPLQVFLFRQDSFILEPEDMNGRILGSNMGFFTRGLLSLMEEKYGVHFRQTRAVYFDLSAFLGLRVIDVVSNAYWNIEPHQLASLGVETAYFPLSTFGVPNYHELVVLCSPTTFSNDPTILKRFQAGLDASIHFCRKHPEKAFQMYLKSNPSKVKSQTTWEKKSWKDTLPLFSEATAPKKAVWEQFYLWMRRENLIQKDVDLSQQLGL